MRKLFWMMFLFAAYIWIVSSGREQFLLDQGRAVYQVIASWFDEADVDFQVKKSSQKNAPQKAPKKKSRRWD